MEPLRWEYAGTLFNPTQDENILKGSGIYIWVFNSNCRRVIYVGTVYNDSFENRWKAYKLNNFIKGKHFMFKLIPNIDPYKDYLQTASTKYVFLAEQNLFWIPIDQRDKSPYYDGKIPDWLKEQAEDYMKVIDVYVCPMKMSPHIITILESQIQITFNKKYNLTYWIPRAKQSWLGRIEVKWKNELMQNLLKYDFKFENVPETLENEDKELLSNLYLKVKEIYGTKNN